jgi:hypothetical protein
MLFAAVYESVSGTFRTSRNAPPSVAIGGRTDMGGRPISVAIDPFETYALAGNIY